MPDPATNPHARSALPSERAASPADETWLEENGLAGDHHLTADGASFNLMAALRLHHASADERASGACFNIVEGEPVSEHNEQRVWSSIRDLATARLEQLSQSPTSPQDRELGRAWREAQAALLHAAVASCDAMMDVESPHEQAVGMTTRKRARTCS